MNPEQGEALMLASRLLAYPDAPYLAELPDLRKRCESLSNSARVSPFVTAAIDFIDMVLASDHAEYASRYVEIFDFTAKASLYMTWHRYGNDRSQGQAMAALNGLYRTAGFEPAQVEMPDYLPLMLEFLSVAPEWACEVILDGFGAEIGSILNCLLQLDAPHARFLEAALAPLQKDYPTYFQPRSGYDPTRRPMANPAPEPLGTLLPHARKRPQS